jgi:MFS transporter, DHA1 family, tetracycline resistance protein
MSQLIKETAVVSSMEQDSIHVQEPHSIQAKQTGHTQQFDLEPLMASAPQQYQHPQWVLLTICLIALFSVAGLALPYPILAPVFASPTLTPFNHWLGLDPTLLFGLAIAASPLGILLGSAVLGAISDIYGRRPVLLYSLLLALLGYGLSAVAIANEQYLWFVLARFLTGICEGSISIARAIAADLHPQINRNKSMAWVNSALHGGWLVGPLVGGFTVQYGVDVPFWVAAGAMLPCMMLVYFLLPATMLQPNALSLWRNIAANNSLQLLREPVLKWVVLIQLSYTIGLNAFYEFYPLWLVEAEQFGSADIGLITAALCLLMVAVSAGPMSWWSHRVSALQGSLLATMLLGLLFALLPQLHHWPAWAVLVLCGVPIGMMSTWFNVYCANKYAALGQGRLMGLLTLLMCAGNIIIALGGSFIALWGSGWTLLVGALWVWLAGWFIWQERRAERSHLSNNTVGVPCGE